MSCDAPTLPDPAQAAGSGILPPAPAATDLSERVLTMRASGMSRGAIDAALNRRRGTASAILRAAHAAGDPRADAPYDPASKRVRPAILDLWSQGLRAWQIAEKTGTTVPVVQWIVKTARFDYDKRATRRRGVHAGSSWALRQEIEERHIPVPAWAERAGLDLEYLSIAETRGEEAAAAHCRRLKAMRA